MKPESIERSDLNAADSLTYQIRAAISEALQLPLEQIPVELAFNDILEWDSMGHMEVMMVLEQHFGIEINTDTIAALTSIPAIADHIRENGHA